MHAFSIFVLVCFILNWKLCLFFCTVKKSDTLLHLLYNRECMCFKYVEETLRWSCADIFGHCKICFNTGQCVYVCVRAWEWEREKKRENGGGTPKGECKG